MSAAIALRMRGLAVDLVELDADWKVYGAGLTITGPTLRAFKQLDILDDVRERGFFSDSTKIFTQSGSLVRVISYTSLEQGVPAAGGILRPELHQILASRVIEAGVDVRLGVTVDTLSQDATAVSVRFSDGRTGSYQAVVGADGAHSKMRERLFPEAPTLRFTGQGCFRVLAPRPDSVTSAEIYIGETVKTGMNPCARGKMYLFALAPMPGNPFLTPEQALEQLDALLAPFGGSVPDVRAGLGADSSINYRPLEAMLLPRPWFRGRVGLIGDAVHATTPHLATGAGLSVEDGIILAEALAGAESIEAGWHDFVERRWHRCRHVVETSLRLGELEVSGGDKAEQARLMAEAVDVLAAPI